MQFYRTTRYDHPNRLDPGPGVTTTHYYGINSSDFDRPCCGDRSLCCDRNSCMVMCVGLLTGLGIALGLGGLATNNNALAISGGCILGCAVISGVVARKYLCK